VKKIYQSREVIEKELTGYQIINNLLDKFCTAYNNDFDGVKTNYDSLLLKILPEKHLVKKESTYERLLQICHFVSLLTDGKAVLYNKIITA
jgi:dGTPase